MHEKMHNPRTKKAFCREHCLDLGDKLPSGGEEFRTLVLHNLAHNVKRDAIIADFSGIFNFGPTNAKQWIWLKQPCGYDSGFVLVVMKSQKILDEAMTALQRTSTGRLTTCVTIYDFTIKFGRWMDDFRV
jgi:hypothetical protein